MAKYILKFIDFDYDKNTIKVFSNTCDLIEIIIDESHGSKKTICLDKSTAIKFAKTLRTEINKIQS